MIHRNYLDEDAEIEITLKVKYENSEKEIKRGMIIRKAQPFIVVDEYGDLKDNMVHRVKRLLKIFEHALIGELLYGTWSHDDIQEASSNEPQTNL